MKKTRIILPVLALIFAIGSAFTTKETPKFSACYTVLAGVCNTSGCTSPVQSITCTGDFSVKIQPSCSSPVICYRSN